MSQIYEGMFLLDNDLVREGWDGAKATVTDALAKHGGKVHTARRWDERRLAYPIRRKQRATYLLAYYEIPGDSIAAMRREFDLSERVLRYLMLAVDEIPSGEAQLAAAESSADFVVPEPPADDVPDEPEEASAESSEGGDDSRDGKDSKEGDGGKATEKAEAGAEKAPESSPEKPAEKESQTGSEAGSTAEAGPEEKKEG